MASLGAFPGEWRPIALGRYHLVLFSTGPDLLRGGGGKGRRLPQRTMGLCRGIINRPRNSRKFKHKPIVLCPRAID